VGSRYQRGAPAVQAGPIIARLRWAHGEPDTRITDEHSSSAAKNGSFLAIGATQAWVRPGVGAKQGCSSQRGSGHKRGVLFTFAANQQGHHQGTALSLLHCRRPSRHRHRRCRDPGADRASFEFRAPAPAKMSRSSSASVLSKKGEVTACIEARLIFTTL